MTELWVPVVTGFVGLLTGVIGASWRRGLELAAHYDVELRAKRLVAYAQLWALLEPLAAYAPPGPITREVFRDMALDLRRWYFSSGLLLSRPTQRRLVQLQEHLTPFEAIDANEEDLVEAESVGEIKELASQLRTRMTRDVLSRRGSLLGADRFAR